MGYPSGANGPCIGGASRGSDPGRAAARGNPVKVRDWPATVSRPLAASRIARARRPNLHAPSAARCPPMGLPHIHRPTSAPTSARTPFWDGGPVRDRPRSTARSTVRGTVPSAVVLLMLAAVLVLGFLGFLLRDALEGEHPTASEPLEIQVGYPRTAEFPSGMRFELRSRPKRLVATTARSVDFLAALCDPHEIVGFPEQALEYATLEPAYEAALNDTVRFYAYTAEPVLRLAPDLVVADLWQSADTHGRLQESGVPLLVLPELVNWSDARATLLALGHLLDREERAAAAVRDAEARMQALAARADSRPRLRALTYSNFGSKGFTAGRGTSVHEILELAGLENAIAREGRGGHLELTFEELLRLDPDVIVVSAPLNTTASHTGDRGGASESILKGEPSLANLRAVQTRSIVALPAGLFATNSHRMVRAAEVLLDAVEALESPANGGLR